MTVNVPCENAEAVGLRQVIDEEMVKKVTKALTGGGTAMPKNWNRRFKHNRDKMKTGDIFELAEVVRNLSLRDHEKGLSTGEKQMFVKAKKILASELMYAKSLDEEAAAEWLDEVLSDERHDERTANKAVTTTAKTARVEVEDQGRRGGLTCPCGPFSRLRVAGNGWATIALRRSLGSVTFLWSPSRCAASTTPTGSTASSSRLRRIGRSRASCSPSSSARGR
jgi:RNA polymerase-interacting CarD/CdnL/TRCF family regulator